MTPAQRVNISNAIWLCQIHAKVIDDDTATWTVPTLNSLKEAHEKQVSGMLGIPDVAHSQQWMQSSTGNARSIEIREYAFARVGSLVEMYKTFIKPILDDRKLSDDANLGMLFCGSNPEDPHDDTFRPPWTVLVNAEWLKWFVSGHASGFKAAKGVPPEHIYGQIPAWPDSLVEFLMGLIESESVFYWRRHKNGYLALGQ